MCTQIIANITNLILMLPANFSICRWTPKDWEHTWKNKYEIRGCIWLSAKVNHRQTIVTRTLINCQKGELVNYSFVPLEQFGQNQAPLGMVDLFKPTEPARKENSSYMPWLKLTSCFYQKVIDSKIWRQSYVSQMAIATLAIGMLCLCSQLLINLLHSRSFACKYW